MLFAPCGRGSGGAMLHLSTMSLQSLDFQLTIPHQNFMRNTLQTLKIHMIATIRCLIVQPSSLAESPTVCTIQEISYWVRSMWFTPYSFFVLMSITMSPWFQRLSHLLCHLIAGNIDDTGLCRKSCGLCTECVKGAADYAECRESNHVRAGYLPAGVSWAWLFRHKIVGCCCAWITLPSNSCCTNHACHLPSIITGWMN